MDDSRSILDSNYPEGTLVPRIEYRIFLQQKLKSRKFHGFARLMPLRKNRIEKRVPRDQTLRPYCPQ